MLEAADDLAATIHTAMRAAPDFRAPGLRSQLLRAVDSVPANISENRQKTDAQFVNGLRISLGSANEVGTHLARARQTGVLDPITTHRCESKRIVVCKMIESLKKRIEHRIALDENEGLGNASG